jgi:hypothetical protein
MHVTATVLLLTAGLCAQGSIVFPSTHATIPDGASQIPWFPFSSGISRGQVVYEDWDLGIPANTPITRIGFRQDPIGGSVPSRLLQLEVRMGTTFATASSLGTSFDGNYVGTPAIVVPAGLYTLPGLVASNPTTVWVDLTTPYLYPGGNLLVEFRVLGNNNGNQGFTYYLDQASYVSPVTAGVQGCQHSGLQRPVLTSTGTQVGTAWNLTLQQAPANTAIVLFVALGQAMTAPYSLQSIGLDPTCMGQLPLVGLASLSAGSNSAGYAAWSVPIPGGLAFNDYVVSSQAVALDFFVPGSLVVSNADQIRFGIAPPSSLLFSQGSASAATGNVSANVGLVTLFN